MAMASASALLSPNSRPWSSSSLAWCVRNPHAPFRSNGPTNAAACGEFPGSVAIGELQVVDAGFIGEKFRLAAARFLPQPAGRRAAAVESGSGLIELASINERQSLLADDGEFRAVIGQPAEARTQLDDLVCSSLEPCGNFIVRDVGIAEL